MSGSVEPPTPVPVFSQAFYEYDAGMWDTITDEVTTSNDPAQPVILVSGENLTTDNVTVRFEGSGIITQKYNATITYDGESFSGIEIQMTGVPLYSVFYIVVGSEDVLHVYVTD